MNNIFKTSGKKKIELDSRYYLCTDGGSGVSLVFHEPRKRINKKTELEEDYIFEDKWYFTKLHSALEKFVELTQNSSETIEEILRKTIEIEKVLKQFRETYKNW